MFSITVDEVDKRRCSVNFSADDMVVALHEYIQSDSTDHECGSSLSSEFSQLYPPPPKPSLSSIEEEDEDQLFPLTSSPQQLLSGSQSKILVYCCCLNKSILCLEPREMYQQNQVEILIVCVFGDGPLFSLQSGYPGLGYAMHSNGPHTQVL
jgi:hypothetical protein